MIHPPCRWRYCLTFLLFSQTILAADCERAAQLAADAYDLGTDPRTFAQQKQGLKHAIRLCPSQSDAHNLLADIFEREHRYADAIRHYQRALESEPGFIQAWFGLGESYAKSNQFPLALEAYLNACGEDLDAQQRVRELLENKRFRITAEGSILNKQSLLLLFRPDRRAALQHALKRRKFKAEVEPVFIFTNLVFETGKAALLSVSRTQLDAIAEALLEIDAAVISISGHTDQQNFRGKSRQQSGPLNQALSEQRAKSVESYLIERGLDAAVLKSRGYGSRKPLEPGQSNAKNNRRVEIEIVED